MSTVTMGWAPSGLSQLAADARAEEKATREPGRMLRIARRVFMVAALMFAVLGYTGGTAQAWPWDDAAKDIGSYVANLCGPNDVGKYVNTNDGFDKLLLPGQQATVKSETATYVPPKANLKADSLDGSSQQRLNDLYKSAPDAVRSPTYQRYGFSTLNWTSYGGGCWNASYPATYVVNGLFTALAKWPVMICMAWVNLALTYDIAAIAGLMIQPIYGMFTAIAAPWWALLATIGGGLIWARTRSLANLLKYVIFAFVCVGTMSWIGGNTAEVLLQSSNLVTKTTGVAACTLAKGGQNTTACKNADNGLSAIDNSLWKGLMYQPWAAGEVGQFQASADSDVGSTNMPWAAAMLNGMYYNANDKAGATLQSNINDWDNSSYSTKGEDGSKMKRWTHDEMAQKIPFLMAIKIMCHDTSVKGTAAKDEYWMLSGNCKQEAGDSTADMVAATQGKNYNDRAVISVTAGFGAYIVGGATGLIAAYVVMQRFMFVYLLGFAALWLTIGLIGDKKRKAFAKKYFELLFANLLKQILAICVLLIVAYSISTIMVPPASAGPVATSIPWVFKPWMMMTFIWALVLMFIPFMRLAKSVAAGDTKVVEKTANAPKTVAKVSAKVAVAVGVTAATGGAGTGASLSKLAGSVKSGGLTGAAKSLSKDGTLSGGLRQAAHVMPHGKARHALTRVSHLSGMAENMSAKDKARKDGIEQVAAMPSMRKTFERDKNGALTAKGRKDAESYYDNVVDGVRKSQSEKRASRMTPEYDKATELSRKADALIKAHPSRFESVNAEVTPKGRDDAVREVQRMEQEAEQHKTMRPFYDAYEKATGERLAGDPKAKPQAKPLEQEDGPQAERAPRPEEGAQPTSAPRPAAEQAPVAPVSPTTEQAQEAREQALNLVGGSTFTRNADVVAVSPQEGAAVLADAGMEVRQVMENPSTLVVPADSAAAQAAPYNNGSPFNMDPSHPATEPLTTLAFAEASGSPEQIQVAREAASAAIGAHGVPDEVVAMRSTGAAAENFQPAQVLNAMPVVTPETSWEERAEAAYVMHAAVSSIPSSYPEASAHAMDSYAEALNSPTVDPSELEALRVIAYNSVVQGASAGAHDVADRLHQPGGVEGVGVFGTDGFGSEPMSVPQQSSVFVDTAGNPPPIEYVANAPFNDAEPEYRDSVEADFRSQGWSDAGPAFQSGQGRRPQSRAGRHRRTDASSSGRAQQGRDDVLRGEGDEVGGLQGSSTDEGESSLFGDDA